MEDEYYFISRLLMKLINYFVLIYIPYINETFQILKLTRVTTGFFRGLITLSLASINNVFHGITITMETYIL